MFEFSLGRLKIVCWALAALLSVGIFVPRLMAQADKGILSGTVTDTSGAVVVGANIQVTDVGTGVSYSAVTDSQGSWVIPELLVGNYQVQATKAGFQKMVHSGITLSVGAHLLVDFKLPVGQATEVVTVTGEVSQVESTTATVSSLVAPKQMADLPLNGRNFEQLLSLAAGVQFVSQQGGGGGVSSAFYGSENNYSVSGSRPVGQAFLLDNTDITNFWQHGTGSSVTGNSLGMDAIQEFSVLTNTYSAEYGGTGAAVNAVTKSGTNDLHGSVYEYLRNSVLDSKNYFDLGSAHIPPYHRNQFGGALGGPIKKDKAFFFVNYEGLRSSLGETGQALVPDPTILSAVDYEALNPYIANILALYPLPTPGAPTAGATPGLTAWYYSEAPFIVNEDYVLGRFDYTLGPKDTFFARYVHDGANLTNPFPSSTIPGWPDLDSSGDHYFTAEERRTVSSRMVNAVRFGAVRNNEDAKSPGSVPALALTPGRDNAIVGPGSGIAPVGPSSSSPFQIVQNRYYGADDVVLSKGRHSIRFGAQIARIQTAMSAPFAQGGDWGFENLSFFLNDDPFLYLGMAGPSFVFTDNTGKSYPYSERHYFREVDLDPYFQDDWKVSARLTLNLGVRYEWNSNAVPAAGVPLEAITNPLTSTGFTNVAHVLPANPNKMNWEPRVGLAWDPFKDHKTSVRAGFGIFHEPLAARTYAPAYYLGPPSTAYLGINLPGIPGLGFLPPSLFFPTLPTSGGVTEFAGLDYDTDHTPYVMQYNLTIQRQITAGTVFSIGFVGSAGVHLFSEHDANPQLAQSDQYFSNGQLAVGPGGPTYNPNASGPRGSVTNPFVGLFANPAFSSLANDEATTHSWYHSLQAMLNRQFSHSLIGQVAYTYSRSVDDGSSSSGLEQGNYETTDTYNQSYDRGPSTYNATQAFRINAVYSLPFKGNRAIAGWSVSPIFTASSGLPVSIQDGQADQADLQGIEGPRPSYAPGGSCKVLLKTVANWWNPDCFILPPYGTLGNVPRNSVYGPGLWDLDFSLIKDTKLTEKLNMQFRAEFFNIMNHPSFGNPSPAEGVFTGSIQGTPPTTPSSYVVTGVDTTPGDPLLGSFECAAGTSCYSPTTGRLAYTAVPSRQIQFALRFSF